MDGKGLGDTIAATAGQELTIAGRALGRGDFGRLELVYNGKVVHRVAANESGGVHSATLNHRLLVSEPGWLALRIADDAARTNSASRCSPTPARSTSRWGTKPFFRKPWLATCWPK